MVDKELYQKLILQGITDEEELPHLDLAGFEIIRRLGQGGMGSVYLAKETQLDRLVAIKVLDPEKSDPVFRERFRREAMMMASIHHPNVVSIHGVTEDEDEHICLVLEYISGGDLRSLISKQDKLSKQQAVQIAIDVCNGLEVVHQQDVIHRDINSQNVLVTEDGTAKVSDLGIALHQNPGANTSDLTETGMVIGTRAYLAPEQFKASHEDIDTRADIWAVGILIYEMVTGELPTAMMLSETLADLPPSLRPIVKKCLRGKPEDRYSTVAELRKALQNQYSSKTNKALIVAAVCAVCAIAVLLSIGGSNEPNIPETPTKPNTQQKRTSSQTPSAINTEPKEEVTRAAPSINREADLANGTKSNDSETINLIDQLPTPLTATRGLWEVKNGVLICQKHDNGSCINFPVQDLGYNYDLQLTLTRHSGSRSAVLFLPTKSGDVNLDLDAWGKSLAGIQDIDGLDMRKHKEFFTFRLERNHPYHIHVKVREDFIALYIDKKHHHTWKIAGRTLAQTRYWKAPIQLGVGAWKSAFSFKDVTVKRTVN